MRVIKYLVILLIVLFAGYCAGWYYVTSKILTEINSKHAGQKIDVKFLDKEEFFVSFDKATASGFPFEIAVKVHGWKEESRGALISYNSPVKIGYNLITGVAFVGYDGEIDAAYKPVSNGFGAILSVNNYLIKVALPLTSQLFSAIATMDDPVEIVNYIGDINLSTAEVKIVDKQEKELFYHKDYEKIRFSFRPAKYYKTLDDLMNDIPKEYKIHYAVQTKPLKASARKIPVSLFYGFSGLPSGFEASANATIKTTAKTINELSSNLDIQAEGKALAPKIDLSSFKMSFKGGLEGLNGSNTSLLVDSTIRIKEGLFDELFKDYDEIKPRIMAAPGGHMINQEMIYIIANKDAFRFKDLENSDYVLNLDMGSSSNKHIETIKINNFSIYSGDSGFKITNESLVKPQNQSSWQTKGVLLLKNYPAVVDFSSGYIYRFGKFRFLNDDARKLYIKVNKEFLKEISDYPTSTSNDLSFDYDADSTNVPGAKIGSVKVSQLAELYSLMLYKKLFGNIDPHGDILNQMKKILPDLNENDPMFKKLLPQITGKDIKELIPQVTKEKIEKILPLEELKKKAGKDLLKGLLK